MNHTVEKPKGLILCATMRSGSTMICEDFWNTKTLGKPEEYFNPWAKTKKHNWEKSYRHIIQRSSDENGFVSIKIMANQLVSIGEGLQHLNANQDNPLGTFFNNFKQYGFVYIKRRDIVKQAISRYMAQIRNANHLQQNKGDFVPGGVISQKELQEETLKAPFDLKRIQYHIQNIVCENTMWQHVFKTYNIPYFLIEYEDIAQHKNTNYLNTMCDYFGLNHVPDVYSKRTLQKMSNFNNQALYDAFIDYSTYENSKRNVKNRLWHAAYAHLRKYIN